MPLKTKSLLALRRSAQILTTLAFISPLSPIANAQNTHRAELVATAGQYLQAVDSPSLSITGDITIELWAFLPKSPPPSESMFFNKWRTSNGQRGYRFSCFSESGVTKLHFIVSSDGTNMDEFKLPYVLALNSWHHLAVSWKASTRTVDFFVDGNLAGTLTGALSSIFDSTEPLEIGGFNSIATLDAKVDELRLWAVARNLTQIRATMFNELVGTEFGLRGYWQLNNSLVDTSGNGNNLLAVSGASFQSSDLPFRGGAAANSPFAPQVGTVGLWHLDGGAATDSAGTNHGTINGPAQAVGKFGDGLDWGTSVNSNYVLIPNQVASSDWTIQGWFNIPAGGGGCLFSATESGGYNYKYLSVTSSALHSAYSIGTSNYSFDANVNITPSSWHLAALRYTGSTRTFSLFLNGSLVASHVAPGAISTRNGQAVIGSFAANLRSNQGFQGKIDEVMMSDRAWKDEELAEAYGGYSRTIAYPIRISGMDARGLWNLNGSFNDSSPHNNVGSGFDVLFSSTDSKQGESATFNGSSSYIALPPSTALDSFGDMTISAWIKVASTPTANSCIYGSNDNVSPAPKSNYNLVVKPDLSVEFTFRPYNSGFSFSTVTTPANVVRVGDWTHITFTRAGASIRLYVNGLLSAVNNAAQTATILNTGKKAIGAIIDSNSSAGDVVGGYFHGQIDEVVIKSSAESQQEVLKYYGGIATASFSSMPGDGSVVNVAGNVWAAARSAAAGTQLYGTATSRQGGLGGYRGDIATDFVERGFFPFDTSPLPDQGVSLNSAVFSFVPTIQTGASICVTPQSQATVQSLSLSDFSAVVLDGSPRYSETFIPPVLGTRATIPLNTSGLAAVSKAGPTRLGTRSLADLEDTGEGLAEANSGVYFSESGANAPELMVEYYAGTPVSTTGTIQGMVTPPPGVTASIHVLCAGRAPVAAVAGAYEIPGLADGSYRLSAFADENGNGKRDALEPFGTYSGNPVVLAANATGIDIALSRPVDSDGDGMDDVWESVNGLVVGTNDGAEDADGDHIPNAWEWLLELLPLTRDSDADGTNDGMEDFDGDGLPNTWEIRYGLDPLVSDKNLVGDGSDGTLVVLAGTTNVLQFAVSAMTGAHPIGSQSLTVAQPELFAAGDLVLVWIAQDPNTGPAANTAGTYEICRVTGRAGSLLQVAQPTRRAFDGGGGRRVLIQRIPEYTTATVDGLLACPAWNGSLGGMLAFTARNLVIGPTGKISADGKGFRGGEDYAQADVDGFQGESYLGGYGVRSIAANGGGGGGGGRSWQYAGNGGGGGGHVTSGSPGSFLSNNLTDRTTARVAGAGGSGYGNIELSNMTQGSGGGSGGQDGDNPDDGQQNGGAGGAGGGAVLVISNNIINQGEISARGGRGGNALAERGGGGGGSGGSVRVAGRYSGSGPIVVTGGLRGEGTHPEIFGGDGSAGRIRVDIEDESPSPVFDPPSAYRASLSSFNSSVGISLDSYDDADLDGLNTLQESQADTNPFSADTDGDGLPDKWEAENGSNPTVADALDDPDFDGLTNRQEFDVGTKGNQADSDSDGASDGEEVNTAGTNPLLADTDGDGMPDKWEIDHGLDPRRDDRTEDRDCDFLSNWDEFNAGLNPALADSNSDGTPDYRHLRGQTAWEALYDRNDRLLGKREERGASFGYAYDGNGNPVRQVKLGRDTDGDGLHDLWEFTYGLNPKSADGLAGPAGDFDGDEWTNIQEFLGQSDPASAASRPGSSGMVLAAVPFPFTPTRYTMGTGQLDYVGTEEIAVSADGDPGAAANFIRVYRQSGGVWIHEDVPVGSYGVTSLCLGALPGRAPAIYAGLRKTGGMGRIVELVKMGAGWQTNIVAESLSDQAWVHGFRNSTAGTDLIMSLYTRFGPSGALYRGLVEGGQWSLRLLESDISGRGGALLQKKEISNGGDSVWRLMDSGGIQATMSKTYPTFDEFEDASNNVVDPTLWTSGGGLNEGGTWSVSEVGGRAQLLATWTDGSRYSNGNAWLETDKLWAGTANAIEILISSASHTSGDVDTSGGCGISLGGNAILSLGARQSVATRRIQLVRSVGGAWWRMTDAAGAWSVNWSWVAAASPLRFAVWGQRERYGASGSASMSIDWVRFRNPGEMLAEAPVATDLASSDSAYRASTRTWYFKTPTTLAWRDAQSFAWVGGGGLATAYDSDVNSWLQGKFTGEYWTGLYRHEADSPWKWVNSSPAAFTSWATGQPGATSNDIYGYFLNGQWFSASGTELKPGVYEISGPRVEVGTTTEPEAPASARLPWGGRSLAVGQPHASSPTESALVHAFIDDKDGDNRTSAGDEFVVAERAVGVAGTDFRTLIKRLLPAEPGKGFGLATFRARAGTADLLATAEPDGQVGVWLPAVAGGTLERKLLTLDHLGKHWHGLERFAIAGGLEGLAGLRVDPAVPSAVQVVVWNANDLGFTTPPFIQQSPPSARLTGGLAALTGRVALSARIWDSEGNRSALVLERKEPASASWLPATIREINGATPPNGFALATLPGGVQHSLIWDAAQDLGSSFLGTVLLRVKAADATGSGAWSESFAYAISGTPSGDSDGDGMPDLWENENGLDALVPDAMGDKDGDGLKNLMEFALGRRANLTDAQGTIYMTIEGGYPVVVIPRNPDAAHLQFIAEVSDDLVGWRSGTGNTVLLVDTPSLLKVRCHSPPSSLPKAYFRLKVVHTAP